VTRVSTDQIRQDSSTALLYAVMGVEKKFSAFSIRPEWRFRRDLDDPNQSQFEFLIGITFRPFQRKGIR
jgi:hypothetical protein